jgi:hypothetical protein
MNLQLELLLSKTHVSLLSLISKILLVTVLSKGALSSGSPPALESWSLLFALIEGRTGFVGGVDP